MFVIQLRRNESGLIRINIDRELVPITQNANR